MRRRVFIALLGGLTTWPVVVSAQKSRTVSRIGVLWHAGSAEEEAVYLKELRQGLADLGYVEGRNIILEQRFPNEIPERFISLAADLIAQDLDVLVAVTRLGAVAAQRVTKTIPIVFIFVPDPVGSKLVDSLARPGGNITGLSNFAHDLTAKRVEHLKELVPGASKVALLVNPNDKDNARRNIEEAQSAADKLQLALHPVEIRAPGEIATAFSKMIEDRINGVVVAQDGVFFVARKEIADLSVAHRLPMIVYSREIAEAGALASYGPSALALFYRAGAYVDKILKGAKPADLPVEQPTKFEFIINLKTAKALGLTVPQSLLASAAEVIE